MARLLLALAMAVLANALPAQSEEGAVNLAKNNDGPRSGTTIADDGSVQQSWKGFVSLPGLKFQDRAGFQTVISGDSSTVAVSSPMATSSGKEHVGSVSIYKREGIVWHLMGEAIIGDTAHEQSGYAIALNFAGDTIAIGSPYYNRTTDPHEEYSQSVPYVGQVRVFTWADEAWTQLGLPIRGTQASGRCGFSVHLGGMGRNLVLGCPRAKDYAHVRPNAGMVKVMKFDETDMKWVSKGSPIYGNTTNILAGIRVSMSGDANTMAFIAPGSNDKDLSPGRVRVYSYEGDDWEPKGEPIVNWDENDLRGRAMYMSRDGMNVAIGSPRKDGAGHVRIYMWDVEGEAWVQRGEPVPGGGSYHSVGTSVAMNTDGTIVAIGAPFNSEKGKTAGRVRVYYWNENRMKGQQPAPGWALKGQKLDGEEGDTNGFSVHLSGKGNLITIGAPQYKWKQDKDAAFFNAAVEPPLDYDDEEDEPEDDEDDEEQDAPMLTANSNQKRVVLSDMPTGRLSSGGDADGKQYSDPRLTGKDDGPGRAKNKGNGRARVLGAFHCEFLGDIEPPDNPY